MPSNQGVSSEIQVIDKFSKNTIKMIAYHTDIGPDGPILPKCKFIVHYLAYFC